MKIAILHPFTPKAAGVVESSVATYHSQPHLKSLKRYKDKTQNACEIHYLTSKFSSYNYDFEGITYRFFPVDFKFNNDHKKWKKQQSKKCLKFYQKSTPDVSIINMSGHSSPFSYDLSKVILNKGKKYIAMLGGQHYSDNDRNREYYKNAHHILVHTHLQKQSMEKLEMFKDLDIRVFPLGVDCDVFKPSQKNTTQAKLLYVGRIVEWKRIHLAIEALDKLVNNGFEKASLDIIGPVFSEPYLDKLKKLVEDKGLDNKVNFLGHKEHNELVRYFQEADLFMLPSDKETFGMVMIEAMACGTPVAGIDCPGGPKDVITSGINGLLSQPENYAQTVLEYFKDEKKSYEVSKNAKEKAITDFSLDKTYQVLESSINDALSNE
ncbi:glycosyltransferase family 4 protein [Mesonia sediminis]|uniref:Glycosyltransferase family 4 protein n=1 Tax=Mesonia sediminis TaxID=1703946 RepID=A0ABW5SFW8_9FLAO